MAKMDETPVPNRMLPTIRATPYRHQEEAFLFTCGKFGMFNLEEEKHGASITSALQERGWSGMSKEEAKSRGVALLME